MVENNYSLGPRPNVAEMHAAGIAYVVIPADVDRSLYIQECYKTSTVSIYSEFNGFMNRVPIDCYSISFVQFPFSINEFGSAVGYVIEPVHKKPFITSIFFKQDEISDIKENQFSFKRSIGDNTVEITGSPADNTLFLNVSASQGGEIHLNLQSKDESAKLLLNVDGECQINSLNNTTIKQSGKLSLVTVNRDNADEVTTEEHTSTGRTVFSKNEHLVGDEYKIDYNKVGFNTDSYLINNGKENFVLGQALKTFLTDFITEVAKSTVTTENGPMPLLNATQIAAYTGKIDKLLSQVGFIDK